MVGQSSVEADQPGRHRSQATPGFVDIQEQIVDILKAMAAWRRARHSLIPQPRQALGSAPGCRRGLARPLRWTRHPPHQEPPP
jgi:hypothetical protein